MVLQTVTILINAFMSKEVVDGMLINLLLPNVLFCKYEMILMKRCFVCTWEV
jgi:hypothetical protein